ncbi:glycosyltransferase family 4 protein [Edaphobacillus lindanitolerans]|uniref:Glycosyltransferase involved in cell wall bisynthesis n=1 Tax=Edaphobacillus lindanitolerans TaxID=550447 RepID=A0A1U7PNP1_9BACI|nr:glycosyltransferase family 4 protein [Edaphobacillus lindanitolerans]SIT73631.1 Glycosyltransferase involved in cell wall bisynthesis [Edaphobacillus lindanitolerans]
MRLLYAHDVRIIKNNQLYYSYTFDYSLWKRYLKEFESMIVASRQIELDQLQHEVPLSSGERVEFIEIPSLNNNFSKYFWNRNRGKKIINDILNKVDCVIVRLPSSVGLLTYQLAKKKNIPVAVELVGFPNDAFRYHGSLLGKMYAPLATFKYKRVLKNATHAIYVTEYALQKKFPTLGFTYSASNVVINREYQNRYLDSLDKRIPEREEIKIGLIGQVDIYYKGVDTALLALKRIIKKMPNLNIKLEIIGGGDLSKWKQWIENNKMKNNVTFLGKLTKNEIDKWFESIYIYIQPSRTEGLPRSVIEAMNFGLPIVATNVGGIPELIDSRFLHNSGDYKALATLILDLLNNEDLRIDQSKRNYNRAGEFMVDHLDRKRNDFYHDFKEFIKK